MMSEKFKIILVKPSEIKVEQRIRKDLGDLNELKTSIGKFGLLQPIGITKNKKLVYGLRRLKAWQSVHGDEPIPCVIVDNRWAELVENIHREELPWQDKVKAITKFHEKMSKLHQEKTKEQEFLPAGGKKSPLMGRPPKFWTQKNTADELGISQESVSDALRLAKGMKENPAIERKKTMKQALWALRRTKKKEGPASEPIPAGRYVCPVCMTKYTVFHISKKLHEFNLAEFSQTLDEVLTPKSNEKASRVTQLPRHQTTLVGVDV